MRCWACALLALCAGTAQAEDMPALRAGFGERWVAPDEALAVQLDAQTAASASALRFFVGAGDVSALARRPTPDRIEIAPLAGGWAAGETELVVWRVADGQWSELARWCVRAPAATTRHRGSPSRSAARRCGGASSRWTPQGGPPAPAPGAR